MKLTFPVPIQQTGDSMDTRAPICRLPALLNHSLGACVCALLTLAPSGVLAGRDDRWRQGRDAMVEERSLGGHSNKVVRVAHPTYDERQLLTSRGQDLLRLRMYGGPEYPTGLQ
jgi:hypothetical protein